MPLSEYEQRVLDQLERDLGADPQLGRAMKRRPKSRSRIALGVVGVVIGLGVVVIGVVTQMMWLGIVGFAIMIAAALWALLGAPDSKGAAKTKGGAAKSGPVKAQPSKKSFMQRMEERYDRRRENGDF
ncbi:DUF3040 domain-containing protein [Demequina capsici]|uniref:DUF3040 domain-containing protein n=1 Tax=Demequina capsici TaxID=3075620 RepID=A0AA96FBA5_9MICO|nr:MULTISPECIES: DUF3040 domain-containing protein [unclassified Demequina]WNM23360.1 DUF3040 domain-containing protein [Demequina sp. OYTSA14]WNM26237.1 DUF3040 domain-containing protein [Demequina sp. PMTSA13]